MTSFRDDHVNAWQYPPNTILRQQVGEAREMSRSEQPQGPTNIELQEPNRKSHNITKAHLFKYIENFTSKNWNFSNKNSNIFYNSAHYIHCGYSLEPPRRGGSNWYPQSMFSTKIKRK